MIFHFFKSSFLCRVLCVILAALTLAFTLSPALVQPAEAVAVADDLTLALTLLFTSWAGITFSSNAGAQTAVSNLLSSKPAVASSVAGLITKGLVTEGSKLLLTGDVRTAFRDVLTDIKDFFVTPADSFEGSLYGDLPLGVIMPIPVISSDSRPDPSFCCIPASPDLSYTISVEGDLASTYPASSYSYLGSPWGFYRRLSNGKMYFGIAFFNKSGDFTWCGISLPASYDSFSLSASKDTVSFKQSQEVDGTQVTEINWGVTFVPDPSDPTSPTDDGSGNVKQPAILPLKPWLDPMQNAADPSLADQDPDLDPEEIIKQLKQLIEGQQSGGDSGTTDPGTDPDPAPDPSEPDTPSSGDGSAPDFNGMMLPGLKDFFPFCIPFDLYNMMQALCAEPEAPKFQFATSFLGQVYTVDIDLSAWDNVAATIRYMVVAIYIVALAVATRKFIKW